MCDGARENESSKEGTEGRDAPHFEVRTHGAVLEQLEALGDGCFVYIQFIESHHRILYTHLEHRSLPIE